MQMRPVATFFRPHPPPPSPFPPPPLLPPLARKRQRQPCLVQATSLSKGHLTSCTTTAVRKTKALIYLGWDRPFTGSIESGISCTLHFAPITLLFPSPPLLSRILSQSSDAFFKELVALAWAIGHGLFHHELLWSSEIFWWFCLSTFKGSVSRDFRPPVFFMIRTHLGP